MIPKNINTEHIIEAINEIDQGREIPDKNKPHKHQLNYNGKTYPPKFVISLANKYANGKELDVHGFSGGEETNLFLRARGFEVVFLDDVSKSIDYDVILLNYLKSRFEVDIDRTKRSWLWLRSSETTLYVNGSKEHVGWYDLEKDIFVKLTNTPSSYYAIVLGDPSKTFVIPAKVLEDIFQGQPMIETAAGNKKKPRWMFIVQDSSRGFTLRINKNKNSDFVIDQYLNNWSQIPDFGDREPLQLVFVTGYNDINLNHSIKYRTLGWRNNSNILSTGDYVFVYNKDTHKLQTAFKIVAKSNNELPIWEEELKSKTQKIEFPNRWDAEVIRDDLQIGLDVINTFEPFNGNAVQKFIPLVGNNSPTPLSNEKYAKFRNFLLEQYLKTSGDRTNNEKFQKSYWKIAPGKQASQWEEQLTNGVIAIGWNELGDLTNKSMNDIIDSIKKTWPESYNAIIPQFRDFLSIRERDIVIANKGVSKVVGIGRIVGKYMYRPDLAFNHTYPVKWFDTIERNISPHIGTWRKTISRISQELYDEIIEQINNNYLLIRHQPGFKRTKTEREYWKDLLGKEYHFGKNVVNYKKIQPGTKTIWFYTDKDKLYLWGHGDVTDITTTQNEDFVATFTDFTFYDKVSGLELEQSTQNKIKSLETWNPYNSIIEIGKETYNEILKNILQLETFDDEPLSSLSDDQIKEGYEKISEILLIPKDKVIEILIALISGRHVLLAGPIGTGKTRLASLIPEIFWAKVGGYWAKDYTATSDWNTQDVIGGIYPKMENGKVVYDIQYGCVVDTIAENWELGIDGGHRIRCKSQERTPKVYQEKKLSYRGIWLVIDEFNRADIDKAFGQLFTSLRTRNLKIPTNDIDSSYKDLRIPQDYRIIGTLNTADKHFLFQLSDALKSRFAYIEVDIPESEDYEKEIYYAMKNAIDELNLKKENYEDFIILDDNSRKIVSGKLDTDFYNFILEAYYYLDSVRIFKKLGTAILQLIYQNMIVAIRITKDPKTALDNALVSTLLPQLENLSLTSLGALEAFYKEEKDENIVEYIKDAYKNPNRQSFVETLEKILDFLKYKDVKRKCKDFENGIIQINDTTLWSDLNILFENNKKNFQSDLVQFKQGITDLVRSAVI